MVDVEELHDRLINAKLAGSGSMGGTYSFNSNEKAAKLALQVLLQYLNEENTKAQDVVKKL